MTIYLLAERIYRIFSGGNPGDDSGIQLEDVKHLVVDQINKMLKTEAMSANVKLGDNTFPALVIASYDGRACEVVDNATARVELPAVPVSLPKGMGVWMVADSLNPNVHFIPIKPGDFSLLSETGLVQNNQIFGQNIYDVSGGYINIHHPDNMNIDNVDIKLVVVDVSTLGDYDMLPIPLDYINDVVKETLNILRAVPPKEDDANDNNTQR